MKAKKLVRYKELNQYIINYYHKVSKRNLIFIIITLCMAVSGFIFLGANYVVNNQYGAINSEYDKQIRTLKEERSAILSGEGETEENEILQEESALTNDPLIEDNYRETIKGTDGSININRNNIFVSDNANILYDYLKSSIYRENKTLESANGAQFMVVTIDKLPKGETIESYANAIFNQLGLGNKEEDNGVLYLIALEDRKFRLEVGYGLESVITDSKADNIINDDDVVEDFRDEYYSSAVSKVVNQVFSLISSPTAVVDAQIKQVGTRQKIAAVLHWGLLVLCIFFIIIGVRSLLHLIPARKYLKELFADYKKNTGVEENSKLKKTALSKRIKETDLYYICLVNIFGALSLRSLTQAIDKGKLLNVAGAKSVGEGRVLINNTLYSGDGKILTTNYIASDYHPSKQPSKSSSSSFGGSDSFGGGSSGGGGASGGW